MFLLLFSERVSALCGERSSLSCYTLHGISLTLVDCSKKWVLQDSMCIVVSGRNCFINGKRTPYKQFIISNPSGSKDVWINGQRMYGAFLLTILDDTMMLTSLSKQKEITFLKYEKLKHSSFVKKKLMSRSQDQPLLIKVLLLNEKLHGQKEFYIDSKNGFFISTNSKKKTFLKKKLNFDIQNGSVFLNKRLLTKGIYRIQTVSNEFLFNGKLYKGSLIVCVDEEKFFFINAVDLEEYVYAVLRSESWPGWPVEVNKALAIACRSYAMAMIERAESGALYHIKSSNIHQQYNLYGDHDNKKIRDAVMQTHGICLTYCKRPVLAMYDSCCGGIIPGLIADELDFKKAPYLARLYACHYCKKSSLYEWKASCEKSHLIELLKPYDISVKNISHMSIAKRDKAGVVKSVKIKDGKKEIIISGKTVYSALKQIKSFSFSIKYTKHHIEFFGKGYGHPYGLCQWGAYEMVKQGALFDAVLKFYYPGTELKSMDIKSPDESLLHALYYSEIKLNTVYYKG